MFSGQQHGGSAEAIDFHTSLFDGLEILLMERYGLAVSEPERSVKTARFALNGTENHGDGQRATP